MVGGRSSRDAFVRSNFSANRSGKHISRDRRNNRQRVSVPQPEQGAESLRRERFHRSPAGRGQKGRAAFPWTGAGNVGIGGRSCGAFNAPRRAFVQRKDFPQTGAGNISPAIDEITVSGFPFPTEAMGGSGPAGTIQPELSGARPKRPRGFSRGPERATSESEAGVAARLMRRDGRSSGAGFPANRSGKHISRDRRNNRQRVSVPRPEQGAESLRRERFRRSPAGRGQKGRAAFPVDRSGKRRNRRQELRRV
jgi:hypothetical protein